MTITHRITSAAIIAATISTLVGVAGLVSYQTARADVQAPVYVAAAVGPDIEPPPVSEPPIVNVRPSETLHDPLTDLGASIDDLAAARHVGWALATLGALIMLSRSLQVAGRRWPAVGWLAWLNTGSRGFALAGLAAVGAAAFDALALGGTWLAVAFAAFGSLLALLSPGAPLPARRLE